MEATILFAYYGFEEWLTAGRMSRSMLAAKDAAVIQPSTWQSAGEFMLVLCWKCVGPILLLAAAAVAAARADLWRRLLSSGGAVIIVLVGGPQACSDFRGDFLDQQFDRAGTGRHDGLRLRQPLSLASFGQRKAR